MHLRGPMNVSQLAVYQIPSEAFKMRKRSTVPFHNHRRALKQRDFGLHDAGLMLPHNKRTWTTTTNCSTASTVTTTVTVTSYGPSLSSIRMNLPNTTYIGPPLPCLPTPSATTEASHAPCANFSNPKYTYQDWPTLTIDLERQHKVTLSPEPPQPSNPAFDSAQLRKRAAAWDRVAYYTSAAPAQATGFSFLANLGDPRHSGTFD